MTIKQKYTVLLLLLAARIVHGDSVFGFSNQIKELAENISAVPLEAK